MYLIVEEEGESAMMMATIERRGTHLQGGKPEVDDDNDDNDDDVDDNGDEGGQQR